MNVYEVSYRTATLDSGVKYVTARTARKAIRIVNKKLKSGNITSAKLVN